MAILDRYMKNTRKVGVPFYKKWGYLLPKMSYLGCFLAKNGGKSQK